ncbi:MAG: methylmalonate-semialdehyde dehydrogenase (CoA acylating) [Gammaproteobacteria bacterium]|nr:methylmalonate-semialdehyde dehydrogenase (CoA acylating) [Gammaproteobacteria bacterium]
MEIVGHLIDGKNVTENTATMPLTNPATGIQASELALASAEQTRGAIEAASKAYPSWRATLPVKRAQVMFRFKSLLEEHLTDIGYLIGREHGKIPHDAEGEVRRGIENVEFACFAPEILKGEFSKNVGPGIDSWSEFQPLGVAAGITPFNFPVMVPLWMYPLAIVCGNTFVLKPSEKDPSAALYVAKLAHEAGLPNGVLNVVNGGKEVVDVLLTDPAIKAISFVGSTPVAESVYNKATSEGKRCQALGGAKNHAIIMPDADLPNAVKALTGAAFGSSGERCMAISVAVVVGQQTAKDLVTNLKTEMSGLRVGGPQNNNNDFGPLISAEHKQKVISLIESAEAEGAELVVDGRSPKLSDEDRGFFLGGTLIDKVKPEMTCYRNEIFGPVLCVVHVDNLEKAMELVSEHEYGNGACLFTRDGEAARHFSDNVEAGMVGINVPLPVPVSYHSFGGWKRSMFGDLSAYGPDGVRFYTRRKTITQRWPSHSTKETTRFSFPAS